MHLKWQTVLEMPNGKCEMTNGKLKWQMTSRNGKCRVDFRTGIFFAAGEVLRSRQFTPWSLWLGDHAASGESKVEGPWRDTLRPTKEEEEDLDKVAEGRPCSEIRG